MTKNKYPKKPGPKPLKPTVKSKVNVRHLLAGVSAENTIASYEQAWLQYLEFGGSTENCLNSVTLAKWRQYLVVERKLSAATINARLVAIKSIARELYQLREITRDTYWDIKEVRPLPSNALIERRRPNNRTKVEPEEMRALCKAPKVSAENFVALRDRALMMTLATSGVRISEAIAMKVQDIVELPGNRFCIKNVMGKKQSEPRTVPLSPEAHDAIMDWLEFRPVASPYIFTATNYSTVGKLLYTDKPLERAAASAHIKKYAEEVGLPTVRAHDFRRFVGTQLAKIDLRQAQLVLGHKDISTTAAYYVIDKVEMGITDKIF